MMNFFRRRQDNRRKKPRPEGRVATFWQSVVSLIFYCTLNDAAGGNDEREVVREPSAGTTSAHSSSAQPFTSHTLVDHRKTNHEPNPCLTSLSSSRALHSSSVDRSKEGKGDGSTPSEKKRNWFSWFKKGSKKKKVTEEPEKRNDDRSAHAIGVKQEQSSFTLSESSFKILQLTASPGGARKAYTSRLCPRPVRKADNTQEKVCPSFDNTMDDVDLVSNATNNENLDNKSLDGNKHHDTMETFSVSDVSSFGASEMSDESSSSFTEVTSLSSGELSDCWGLSDGQLPPSISSASTDSIPDDGEDHIQVSTTSAVEVTVSASSDASERNDTPVGTHGLKSQEIPATCSSGSAATSGDIDEPTDAPNLAVDNDGADILGDNDTSYSTNIEVPSDAIDKEASSSSDADIPAGDIDTSYSTNIDVPTDAVDKEASSYDVADIPGGDIDTSDSTDIVVPTDAPNTVDTLDRNGRFGEVRGGTITDVYALIVRTLNLGLPKPTDPVPRESCSTHNDKSEELCYRLSTTAVLKDTVDIEGEEGTSEVPEHTTPSLHKLHTEWPEHHVNIEVLLGLKAPKNSFEALAVQKFREQEASDSANNTSLTGAVSTPTEKDHLSGSIEAESEMAVDSGIGSRGDCMPSEP